MAWDGFTGTMRTIPGDIGPLQDHTMNTRVSALGFRHQWFSAFEEPMRMRVFYQMMIERQAPWTAFKVYNMAKRWITRHQEWLQIAHQAAQADPAAIEKYIHLRQQMAIWQFLHTFAGTAFRQYICKWYAVNKAQWDRYKRRQIPNFREQKPEL